MIDVLVPAFNAERYVEASLRSVLTQTVREFRLIIVDDGSTDGTAAIVRKLAAEDDRITLLQKPNSGIVDTLNLGLTHCTAEFVARMDVDDICYPERFERQLAYLKAHPDCVVVGCNVHKIDHLDRYIGRTFWGGDMHVDWRNIPAREAFLMHPFLMLRRSAIAQVGGYRHYFNCEDTDLYWRLHEIGRLHNLSEVLGDYRHHPQSITNGSSVNSRICAVMAQVAAISARRRASGKPDLAITPATTAAFRQAGEFDRILDLASDMLDPEEAAYVRVAAAAKFIELKHYRKFHMSVRDIRTILRELRRGRHLISKADRKLLRTSMILWVRPKFGIKGWWQRTVQRPERTGADRQEVAPA